MVANRATQLGAVMGTGGGVTGAAPAPAQARTRAFESAKDAAAQRSAVSIDMADSASAASIPVSRRADMRRVDGRTFALRDGVWTDLGYRVGNKDVKTIRIKAFSKAYFDLIGALPELRGVFALGDRVAVQGRKVAIVVGDSGEDDVDVRAIVRDW